MYTPDLLVYTVYIWQEIIVTTPPYPHYIFDIGADYDAASSISDPYSMWIVRQGGSASPVLWSPQRNQTWLLQMFSLDLLH